MTKIYPSDTQWAIAAQAPLSDFIKISTLLTEDLQRGGHKVTEGKDGFAALLVFGGIPSETLASHLAATVTPVYLLDFNEDAPRVLRLKRKGNRLTESRVNEHPAEFLASKGITAPGYEPVTSSVISVGLVVDTTPEDARKALPAAEAEFRQHHQGILVVNDRSGGVTEALSAKLHRCAYMVSRDLNDDWFACYMFEPGQEIACYSPSAPNPNFVPMPSFLDGTTLDDVLVRLGIPRSLLYLPDASEPSEQDRIREVPIR